MRKICIIKLKSAGDVVRTTPILRAFPDCRISWITDEKSYPFIKGNSLIQDVFLIRDLPVLGGFDALYNFDEDESACKMAESISAGLKKGYGWRNGGFYPFDRDSEYAYRLTQDNHLKFRLNKKTYQQIIFEMAGLSWSGEDYVLNFRPDNKIIHRVGLNYMAGEKFPNKIWVNWRDLPGLFPGVSVQVKFGEPIEYINWINSCEVIVTGDSLGMHIALALGKKVIALFGETSMNEIEMYSRGIKLSAGFSCSPCYKKKKCDIRPSCMEAISAQAVGEAIMRLSGK